MAIYSIKDLEKLTGIKAHTLRVWEQRYEIVTPSRTSTNIRYYDDEDLRVIMNIALLNKNGIKISKIAKMSKQEMLRKVAEMSDIHYEFATQLDALTLSVVEMDDFKFDRIIGSHIGQLGFERAMLEVIYPLLEKINLMWFTGSISIVQETFITNLLKFKAIAAIEKETVPLDPEGKKFLLYLPEGERQELTLLFIQYLLKKRGYTTIFLGNDIALADLLEAIKICKPNYIFTIVTETLGGKELQPYINKLFEKTSEVQLILTGYQIVAQAPAENNRLITLNSLKETLDFIEILDNKGLKLNDSPKG